MPARLEDTVCGEYTSLVVVILRVAAVVPLVPLVPALPEVVGRCLTTSFGGIASGSGRSGSGISDAGSAKESTIVAATLLAAITLADGTPEPVLCLLRWLFWLLLLLQ